MRRIVNEAREPLFYNEPPVKKGVLCNKMSVDKSTGCTIYYICIAW
jgi:hypothetical protein